MSKKEKRLQDLFSNPPPKDFSWDSLISIMNASGFKNECTGGSHYVFEHTSGLRVRVSKTHPGGILKPYQVSAVKEALEKLGLKP
ncbi:MAG: type II toxin-antitoxin system HicA family toxin [Methylotenera sp.]|nr:type II toxin-antitoxin system HicA family toxin [Methylotenera sp.]MDD4925539.1 type II toxin-antitoxin system HicA family toxin [Methylotenera sp.]